MWVVLLSLRWLGLTSFIFDFNDVSLQPRRSSHPRDVVLGSGPGASTGLRPGRDRLGWEVGVELKEGMSGPTLPYLFPEWIPYTLYSLPSVYPGHTPTRLPSPPSVSPRSLTPVDRTPGPVDDPFTSVPPTPVSSPSSRREVTRGRGPFFPTGFPPSGPQDPRPGSPLSLDRGEAHCS